MLNLPPFGLFFILLLHIAAGFVALLSGLVPLFTAKGRREHRGWGRVFVWAMGLASLTAFPLAYWREDIFQAEVGVFTGYLTLFGLRAVQAGRGQGRFGWLDWGAALTAGAAFVVFGTLGAASLLAARALPHAGMSVFFGLLGLGIAGRDLHALAVRDISRRRVVVDHMIALCLALLAGYSAFLNTQFDRMTGLSWSLEEKMSLPFVVGLPGLIVWAFLWERKLRVIPRRAKKRRSGPKTDAPVQSVLAPEVRRLCGLAVAEGVSFLLLLCVGVPLKHLLGIPQAVRVLGPIHGGLFILYVVAVFQAAPRLRWSVRQIALALGAGVVPAATFFLEARLRKPDEAIRGDKYEHTD